MYELINSKLISGEIESKKRNWGHVDKIVRLIDDYPEKIEEVIEILHNLERNSNRDLKIEKNIEEMMLQENLIEYNIFGEVEIVYFS